MFTSAIVTFGTLIAHTLGALIFLINVTGAIAGHTVHVAFPDVYGSALALTGEHPPKAPGAVFAFFLLTCAGLSAVASVTVFLIIRYCATIANAFRQTTYGWVAGLVDEGGQPKRAIAAFVVTNLVKDGAYVGCEGLVEKPVPRC